MTTARKKIINAWLYKPVVNSLFDMDCRAVAEYGPWIKVVRSGNIHTYLTNRMLHPKGRLDYPINLNHTYYVKNIRDIPKWMRDRIAILRIVPGVWVAGIGQCWDDQYYSFEWIKENS